jgi:long-subunit fatty acid transport protein
MKRFLLAGTALTLIAGAAQAGGIDRSRAPYSILFEEGSYAQLSFSTVNPDVSGDYIGALGGGSTDNMAEGYGSIGLAYKQDVGNGVSLAFMLSEPYGANASYTSGLYTGLAAEWESQQIALLAKYQANENISVYGGLRFVQSSADIAIPDALIRGGAAAAGSALAASPAGTLNYGAQGASDSQLGYVFGAAYERKDIALRVSLTYESQIDHSFDTAEQLTALDPLPGGQTEVSLPQSITLDFQTGVAADTLMFGSIRWTEWSVYDVAPPFYGANFGSVVALTMTP